MNFKILQIPSVYTILNGLSLKTISRYCPFNPMPESTLSPSKGLRIWPQSTVYTEGDAGREQCKGYSCLREAPQVRTKGRKINTKP